MHQHHFHQHHLPSRPLTSSYGSDDGVFGLDDAFEVIVAGSLLFVAAGVALAIGPHPFSDPFGVRSRKERK
jgi:hypothetical protein